MLSTSLSMSRSTSAARAAPPLARSAAAGTLVLLLAGCSSVDWVKTRFVEPPDAQAAAPSPSAAGTAASPAPAPTAASSAQAPAETSTYRRRLRDAPTSAKAAPPSAPTAAVVPAPTASPEAAVAPIAVTPAVAVAAPVAVAPTPAAPVALPPAVAIAPPAPVAPVAAPAPAAQVARPPAVAVAPPAPVAQPLTAPVPPRATTDMAPGHFAVQVAAFMTPASAEAQRSRVATQMRAASMPQADDARVLKLNDRYFVLVGDFADRAQAEALAAQMRTALQRDLAIFRR